VSRATGGRSDRPTSEVNFSSDIWMGRRLGQFEEFILLALVRLRENGYGVTIRREIAERTGLDVSVGAVYATLERLERKGYVSSWMGEATINHQLAANFYCI
jgi:hypothetical protein